MLLPRGAAKKRRAELRGLEKREKHGKGTMSDTNVNESLVRAALAEFKDPESGRSIVQMDQVRGVRLEDGKLEVALGLTTWSAPLWDSTRSELIEHLRKRFPSLDATVDLVIHERKPEKMGEIGLSVKNVIAVGSGKGGVGKSSVAAYLACGLKRAGCVVGLMDADLYGPSIPHLFGSRERPEIRDERIQPVVVDGLPIMSMGFLVPEEEAVIWRGPMLHNALQQFLRDTAWGDLDYLIVDMPPGTGDVAISLSQLLPLSGAVVVCTPQDVALLDAVKAVSMFRKVNIDVLGMVENMSFFLCPSCDSRHDIFGSGGAKRRAEALGVPFLGEVPICTELRVLSDEGRVCEAFDQPRPQPYLEAICRSLVANLSAAARRKPKMPTLPVLG